MFFAIGILYMGGFFSAFGWFIRTGWLGKLIQASNPNTIQYGYGIGDNGRWYGTGYGYLSGDVISNDNPKYASGTQSNVGVALSGGASTTLGIFTWRNNVQIEIPIGTVVTVWGGQWNGLLDIPTYSTTYGGLGSNDVVQWVVNLNFSLFVGGATFSRPIKIIIPVNSTSSVYVRANHNDGAWLTTAGLTTSPTATCNAGIASAPYDGSLVATVNKTITMYTCAASTFVAYTETTATTPSNWWWGGWGWGWGWGWWGVADPIIKDYCPNGDFSSSYYDGLCGVATTIVKKISSGEVANNLVLDTTYSQEYNDAYGFAFTKGITTIPTIKQADITGKLLRSTMAKMIVNYAINVLGKTPDTWANCSFDDISTQSAEMRDYTIKACQLWLMSTGKQKFHPSNIVTRDQLWTVLSRLFYNTADSGNPYYTVHLNLLKQKGIIKDTTPNLMEKRITLMLMLMRGAQQVGTK